MVKLLIGLMVCLSAFPALASEEPQTLRDKLAQQAAQAPNKGDRVETLNKTDRRRKDILTVLRPTVEKDLNQKVMFIVDRIKAQGRWAFVVAHPQTTKGKAVDFSQTRYKDDMADGLMDGDTIYALFKWDNTSWALVDYVVGPTDVAYAAWPEDHGCPPELLGLTP